MKTYKKPVIRVKGVTTQKTLMKSAKCSGCSKHTSTSAAD